MRYYLLLVFCFAIPIQIFAQPQPVKNSLTLWYKKPAGSWDQALPVGNGKLGAMIFGGITNERIQLNEESVWTRRDTMLDQQSALAFIPEIREALFNEKVVLAEELTKEHVLSNRLPSGTNTYQTLGDLYLKFEDMPADLARNYCRTLDLNNAKVNVTYSIGKTVYLREVFSSAPDQALVIRLSASQSGQLSLQAALHRPGDGAQIWSENGVIKMREHVGQKRGVIFETWLYPKARGGTIRWENNNWIVEQADEVIFYLVAATNYHGQDPEVECRRRIENLSLKRYEQIYEHHISDYHRLFNRVHIELGSSQASLFATDERIDAVKRGLNDPDLVELYFQFGRYLLISSSRPGSLPANLQGLWCDGLNPPWNSDYHININLQMNYWPAEITNLPECHEPLFDFIQRLVTNGQKTAQTIYGCRGFVAHHTTDLWYPTSPFGLPVYGMWPMGAAWLVQHPWEHFVFNGDTLFLQDRAWPLMKQAALFFVDFLVPDPRTGLYVSGPSMSPENSYLTRNGERVSMTMGPSMDQQIIYNLFTNCIHASEILDQDPGFRDTLISMRSQLMPVKIGNDGRIMEWREEYPEAEPGHRHISHLFALHPGIQYTFEKTPEYMKAAQKTLEYRLQHGGGHTGWSRAWIINFYARLRQSNKAYDNLQALIGSSTLPNLFDNHPPFQIDGNFGGCAGIAEMLLQSHEHVIRILPALPDKWSDGHIKGLKTRGGFEIDISWQNGRMTALKVTSRLGLTCCLVYGSRTLEFQTNIGETYFINQNLERMY